MFFVCDLRGLLCQHISKVFGGGYVTDIDISIQYTVTNVRVSNINVLEPHIVFHVL